MSARLPLPTTAAALALLALAAALAACQETEEEPTEAATATASGAPSGDATAIASPLTPAPSQTACNPNPSPALGTKLWRWGDLTVRLPEDGGIVASGSHNQHGRPQVDISVPTALEKGVTVDAQTGLVVDDRTSNEQRSPIAAALSTISICPFDPATAPWPYAGDPPNEPMQRWGAVSYSIPDPSSGLFIGVAQAACAGGRCPQILLVATARSRMSIDAGSGAKIEETVDVHPTDVAAFDRFVASLKLESP